MIVSQSPDFNDRFIDLTDADIVNFEAKLAGMLEIAAGSGLDLRQFNVALKEADIGKAVETRKLK